MCNFNVYRILKKYRGKILLYKNIKKIEILYFYIVWFSFWFTISLKSEYSEGDFKCIEKKNNFRA